MSLYRMDKALFYRVDPISPAVHGEGLGYQPACDKLKQED